MHQKTTLDNGLRIITANMPHTRSVCVSIFVGTGSRYESEERAGVSHFIEHLLFKGTYRRPAARDISEAIEGVGGIFNGGTDKELTVLWCKVTRPHFELAADVLVDMMLNSKFDPQDIEKERLVIVDEISMCRDVPGQRVEMLIDELIWPGHPLGRDIAGRKESVSSLTREMIIDYLRSQYSPGSTVVSVAGDVSHQEVVDLVSRFLGGWRSEKARADFLPFSGGMDSRVRIETRDTEQAHLSLALPGLSVFHPRRFVLGLLNVILGEGMSSRLFSEIRDRLGLAYSIHSYTEHFLDTGSLTVSASVEPGKLTVALEAILKELARLKEPVPEAELTKAREISKGRLILRLEESRNVAGWAGGQEVLTGQILTPEEVVAILEAITAEELQQIAHELLVGSQLRLAVVGPVKDKQLLEGLLQMPS